MTAKGKKGMFSSSIRPIYDKKGKLTAHRIITYHNSKKVKDEISKL